VTSAFLGPIEGEGSRKRVNMGEKRRALLLDTWTPSICRYSIHIPIPSLIYLFIFVKKIIRDLVKLRKTLRDYLILFFKYFKIIFMRIYLLYRSIHSDNSD
jgi:hypothetical protein